MNEQEKQRLLEEIESVEQKLNTYTEARVEFEKFTHSYRRFKYWMVVVLVLLTCQIGVLIYDMTLPVYQNHSWPWIVCWVLAFLGQGVPQREMKASVSAQAVAAQQGNDDYYKALTGTDRQ